jgi:hypothetical protein
MNECSDQSIWSERKEKAIRDHVWVVSPRRGIGVKIHTQTSPFPSGQTLTIIFPISLPLVLRRRVVGQKIIIPGNNSLRDKQPGSALSFIFLRRLLAVAFGFSFGFLGIPELCACFTCLSLKSFLRAS